MCLPQGDPAGGGQEKDLGKQPAFYSGLNGLLSHILERTPLSTGLGLFLMYVPAVCVQMFLEGYLRESMPTSSR